MNIEQPRAWTCPPRRVLIATDFGEASSRALAAGGLIAQAYGAELRVLHAERFEAPPYFTLDQIARLEGERRAAQAAAVAHLRRAAAAVTAYPVEADVADEPPIDAILRASHAADLVVLGTHGRRGPGRWWLGSVAERVVRAARVPVLVMRADTGPAKSIFERVAVAGAPGSEAHAYAAVLGATFGSAIDDLGPPAACGEPSMRGGSLVVVALGPGDALSMTAGAAAAMLAGCRRPILFVPSREIELRRPA